MKLFFRYSIWYLVLLSPLVPEVVTGQVVLYLEDMNEVKAIKIPEGSVVSLKTTEEKVWTYYKLDRLLAEEKIILHERGFIDLDQVTHIRIQRKWVKAIGNSLMSFGAAWTVYGVIAAAATNTVQFETSLLGIIPFAAGYIMKKVWLHKIYPIGKKNRLKILDLSFPDDPYGVKTKMIRP